MPPRNRAVASETVTAQDMHVAAMMEHLLSTSSCSAAEGIKRNQPLFASGSLAWQFGDKQEAPNQSSQLC